MPSSNSANTSCPAASAEEPSNFYSTHSTVIGWSRDTVLVASGEELRCTILSGADGNSEVANIPCKAVLRSSKVALPFTPVAHARKEDSQREHAPRSHAKHARNSHRNINVNRGRRDLNGAVRLSQAQRTMIA